MAKAERRLPPAAPPPSVPLPPVPAESTAIVKANGGKFPRLRRWFRGGYYRDEPYEPRPFVRARPRVAASLFALGNFELSSGDRSFWKIQCEAFTDADWYAIAHWMMHAMRTQHLSFSEVVGVPTGGLKLAEKLYPYRSTHSLWFAPRLVVDDVLTSGVSITQQMNREDDFGFVVFARGQLPPRVRAMWKLGA
jgi:hypothetical protein